MIDLDSMSDDDKLAALESIHKSIAESKEVQKQKIAANVDLVLQALKKMESDIRARYDETGKAIEKRVASIKDGKDGRNGVDGKAGRDGRSGADGATGPRGADGLNGRDGRDGEDGVSVTDAHIDFDGSLIIHLSTGRVINVGEVVAPDLVERIKVITNGGGTSQQVLDTLVSLQNQINAITTGVTYQGTWNASTNTPTLTSSAGTTNGFYIVSVAGSTTLNGTSNWGVGDWAIFNGSIWQRVEGGSSGNFVDLSASGTVTLSGLTASTALALDASKNIVSVTNTGTGNNVLATSPTLVTPVLGTPTSGDFSTGTFTWPTFNQNTTGTASNVTGTVAVANGGTGVTSSTGTTNVVLSNSPVLVTPDLGTPSALVGTNITGTATAFTASNVTTNANLTGAVTSIGNATSLGSFTSAQLLGALTDETGTGAAVFATSPTLITPALGTPASGVVTNLTGTASININGTVGATTANTGAFTTLTTSSTVTHNGGTANGVTYLNGSKVLTSGSALTFDGTTTLTAPSFQATTTTTSLVRNVNNSFLGIAGGTSYSNGAALLLTGSTNADVSVAFLDANSSVFRSAQGGTEYMRLTSTGLGIGTSSPTQKITANGSIRLTGNSGNFNETGAQMDSYDGLRLASYISTGSAIQFLTNASGGNTAERARIDSSGNLLVGTTSTISSAAFTLVGNVANNVAYIRNTNSTPYGLRVNYSAVTPNNTDFFFHSASDATAVRFEVRSNGGIANYSANNVNLSDRREKTNFAPAKSYLDVICAIPVQTFNYIDQNMEEDGGLTLGVIAQDVQAVAPELVMESNWAGKDAEPKMRLSIYQTDLQYALMKCIQEQQALIQSLKARLDAANL